MLCIVILFATSACSAPEDKVLVSLGESSNICYYSNGRFQDFTDYAKYSCTEPNLVNNAYLKPINDNLNSEFLKYLDNFESWVNAYQEDDAKPDIAKYYDFDKSIISEKDYLYIYDASYDEDSLYNVLEYYDIYFFDFETNILYYFHNNI